MNKLKLIWDYTFKVRLMPLLVLIVLVYALFYSLRYFVDTRIIAYVSAYDAYKSQQQNTGGVEQGDGEVGKLDHSKDNLKS